MRLLTVPGVSFVQSYKYDSLYRLTEAVEKTGVNQNWSQNWEYDRFGNRTGFTQNIAGVTTAPNPAVDPLTNRFAAGQGFTYDKNGNVVADIDAVTNQARSFVFNGDNKQSEVRDANGVAIAKYSYDGEGKRVKKEVIATGETTVFVYSSGKLVAEYSTAAPPATPQVSYTTTDHLGSPRVITNATGQVISRRDFLPFGEDIVANVGGRTTALKYGTTDTIRQKFTGYERDTETDLDFAKARMYAQRLGRFSTVDPLLASGRSANPQTFNRYAYVLNSPLIFVDANGLYPVYWDGKNLFSRTQYKGMYRYDGPKIVITGNNGYYYTITKDEMTRGKRWRKTERKLESKTVGAKLPEEVKSPPTPFINRKLIDACAREGIKKEKIMFGAVGTGVAIGTGVGAASYLGWITIGKTTIMTLGISGADYVATHPSESQQFAQSVGRAVGNNPDKAENIALGVSEHLDAFSARVGGSTWQQWGAEQFQTQFLEKINNAATKIHFNLDGISNVNTAIQQGSRGFQNAGTVTNWELYQIYSNPEVLQRTVFYLNGVVVNNPFGQ